MGLSGIGGLFVCSAFDFKLPRPTTVYIQTDFLIQTDRATSCCSGKSNVKLPNKFHSAQSQAIARKRYSTGRKIVWALVKPMFQAKQEK